MKGPQIVTPTLPYLPEPCNSQTVYDPIDPATLSPIQRVAVDALRAELDRLYSAALQVCSVLVSISEVETSTAFPYRVCPQVIGGELLMQVGDVRDEFDARFARVLRPWLDRSTKAEDVARRVREEIGA